MNYIHYGHSCFDRNKLLEGFEEKRFRRNDKPHGLWASPVGAEHGWKEWCENEEFETDSLKSSFQFGLKANAKILHIHSLDDAKKYLFVKDNYRITNYALNLKRIYKHYDGMELHLSDDWSMRDNNVFYTWDVDSICIWNPDVIEERSERK